MRARAKRHALPLLGATLIALTLAALSLHVPGADNVGSISLVNEFVAVLFVSAIVYLFAARLVLRQASSHSVLLIIAVAVAMRIPPLLAPPFLSSDMYRYVWDGRVQTTGINPYRYVPADTALQSLRDDAIFPHI